MTPRCLSDDRCGRTAYPVLTGQRTCGEFSWEMLNQHMSCSDAERTLPVCARKPVSSVNTSKAFREMPASYRLPDHYPPVPALERAWVNDSGFHVIDPPRAFSINDCNALTSNTFSFLIVIVTLSVF